MSARGRTGSGRLLAAVVLLATLAGCGSGGSSGAGSVAVQPDPSATGSTTALPSAKTLQTYFDGVASGTVSGYDDAKAAAVPGSTADRYVTYLRAAAEAVLGGGHTPGNGDASADVVSGAFRFCTDSGSGKVCYRYTDITGAEGKVADFSVNGRPVADRVVGGGSPVPASGVDGGASLVAAFENTSGDDLFVAVRVRAAAHDLSGVQATYAAAGGRPVQSSRMTGPDDVHAGAVGSYVFAFPGARLGGTLTLALHGGSPGGPATQGTVVLAVR
jgi:hypothetical protein